MNGRMYPERRDPHPPPAFQAPRSRRALILWTVACLLVVAINVVAIYRLGNW